MLNVTSRENVGTPCSWMRNSGDMLPRAEMKKRMPATMSERLRPRRVASKPERPEPMMQPMRALLLVKPCIKSVY